MLVEQLENLQEEDLEIQAQDQLGVVELEWIGVEVVEVQEGLKLN